MVTLVILLLVLVLVVFPLWAIIRIISLGRENDAIAGQLHTQAAELTSLRDKVARLASATPPVRDLAGGVPPRESPLPSVALAAAAPALPAAPLATTIPAVAPIAPSRPVTPVRPAPAAEPPPIPPRIPSPPLPGPDYVRPPAAVRPSRIDWEQFMGVKLLAWLGGLAALLGVAFFVKYSFDHELIPPEVRVALGFLFALALVVGGLRIDRVRYEATAQTLIATGIVSLYAVTFACNSVYHFAFFGQFATFAVMSLITGTAFLLAVRLEARVIAVLGILGGFLTPVLLSTGRDNAAGLFGYVALLDAGLLAVALHRRWNFLVLLGAAGTVILQLGWAGRHLDAGRAPTAMVVCLAFCALFLAAYLAARRLGRSAVSLTAISDHPGQASRIPAEESPPAAPEFLWSAIAFPFVAFGFAFSFLAYAPVAARPGLLFSFVLAADACLLALAWLDEEVPKLHLAAGAAVFALLAAWTATRLAEPLLPWALAFYLLHAVLHTGFPLILERRRPASTAAWWSQLFPPLALVLMLIPLFKLDDVSLVFWPCVLLVDLLAIGLALVTASLTAVAVVLVLTLAATGVWLVGGPHHVPVEPAAFLFVVGGFALVFFAAGLFLSRRLGDRLLAGASDGAAIFNEARAHIPAFSALLPFLLLILMTQRLPLADPSPIFGLALLLVALTLALAALLTRPLDVLRTAAAGVNPPAASGRREPGVEWLPACALVGVAALEYAWRARHAVIELPATPLAWFLVFHAVFSLYPFVFRRRFAELHGPWAVAALAGVAQFPLVYRLVEQAWPNDFLGVLPALFAVPPLLSLILVLRAPPAGERARLNQLAWFGGVALLFITLIFPIQFEREWLTLGWALEGVALLWLFHRVPHPGLPATGVVLLVAAFARLALNPAVLEYHARAATPVFNWYLYSYGLVTACLFAGARLLTNPEPVEGLAPPRDRVTGISVPPLLNTLGTVLAFLLLNLEIADYFSPPGGRTLTFQFSGNFARDMTYTIAWALFALGLLLVSMWKKLPAGRYAAIALLGVTLLKLFFHDLAHLEALYRIGALFAVAVIAILASFAYQRFLPPKTGDDVTKS